MASKPYIKIYLYSEPVQLEQDIFGYLWTSTSTLRCPGNGTQSPDFVSQFSFEEISKIGEKKSGFQLFSQDNQKFSIISIKTHTSSDDNLPIISMFC